MFSRISRKSQAQQPADASAGSGQIPRAPGGRHALGAPHSEAYQPRPAADARAEADDRDCAKHGKTAARLMRFPDLRVMVRDGTVYDTAGRPHAVGPLAGARAHVTVLEPDPRKANLVTRALGGKKVAVIIPLEITVTVAGTVLTRARGANGAGTNLIRSARKQAAEFNDLARHWPG